MRHKRTDDDPPEPHHGHTTNSPLRLTVQQYDQLIQTSIATKDDKTELIQRLVVARAARNRPHVVAAKQGISALAAIVPADWHVAKEDPITVSNWSKPEPDLAIIRGHARDYLTRDVTPADVALIIEIAESSLTADRLEMQRIDAAAAIPTYWIVNLVDAQIEVHTNPGPLAYVHRTIYTPGEEIPILIAAQEIARLPVNDFLP